MYLALTVRVRVLPDPGPAITRDGPSTAVTAALCSGLILSGVTSSFMNRLGIDSAVQFRFKTRSSLFETLSPPFNLSSFEQRCCDYRTESRTVHLSPWAHKRRGRTNRNCQSL